MVTPRINLKGAEIDAAGALAVVTVLAAGYLLLIRGPLQELQKGHDLEARQRAVASSIRLAQAKYVGRLQKLEQGQQVFATKAGWLKHPDLPDEVLGRTAELARQCDVRIVRWQPQGTQSFSEYQARSFSVEGVASWPALLRWFALMEEGAPLLDVTHFMVTAPTTVGQTGCDFSCSLRLYLGAKSSQQELAAVMR